MDRPTINVRYPFDIYIEAILNTKNAMPPITTGLNLISNPEVVVAIPAIKSIIGGGLISNFTQIKSNF